MRTSFQVGIIGAGLAGLSLAIQLSRKGYSVGLFEKSEFPFHKLCGEYLSRESLPFLASLGLDLDALKPAQIDQLLVTNASGKRLSSELPLGGVGISRWQMDFQLYKLAKQSGAIVLEKNRIKSTRYVNKKHILFSNKGEFECDLLISAFGKKSILSKTNKDIKADKNDYIGVKYHVRYKDQAENLISMHNFKDGYCGVCRLEKDWVSLCYLSHTDNLKQSGNSISDMEKEVLFKNKEIEKVFENAEFLYNRPITVSNIDFKKKKLVENNILYVGDAAGLITPLCGNGMSMSLHGSYILGELVLEYLDSNINKKTLFDSYQSRWDATFKKRMAMGRSIQKAFRNERNADLAVNALNAFPFLNKTLIKLTHGSVFYS